MLKELSIENIKKELIDKISNNEEVLEIFRKREYSKDEGKCLREYGDSFIKDNYIFNYHVPDDFDKYIFVEANEFEYPIYGNSKKEIRKSYSVDIMVEITDISELDKLSILLGDIATELYPNRYNYTNQSLFVTKKGCFGEYRCPKRIIKFTIE